MPTLRRTSSSISPFFGSPDPCYGIMRHDYNDFDYNMIKDMHVVSCFIKEWGDIVIMLKDDTKVDLRSFPKFREIAKYCLAMAQKPFILIETRPKAF
ncbi:hypothetical protein JHK86_051279 [Glycine max]|nr:hypothetical protein JHK86_051279 [Glycine max]